MREKDDTFDAFFAGHDPCGDRILANDYSGGGPAKTKANQAGPPASPSLSLHPNANDKEQDHPGSPDPRAT